MFAVCFGACSEPTPPLSWHIRFADGAMSRRAVIVQAEIRTGSCAGPAVFSSRGVEDGSAAAPGALPSGHYGFFARARDENCFWFAEACVERDLPSTSPIDLRLSATNVPSKEASCELAPGAQASPVFDAGSQDGGEAPDRDATVHVATRDAGVSPAALSDAAPSKPKPDGVDTATRSDDARCGTTDRATVACYEFSNDLRDSSMFDRDHFEHTTATDIALRVGTSYYLAFSYDGTTARLYVDGRQVANERIALPLSAGVSGPLFIGSGSPSATRPFDGLIDALRISALARDDDAICIAANKQLTASGCH